MGTAKTAVSYDIYPFRPSDGESVEHAFERVVEGNGGGGPGTAEAEALKSGWPWLVGYGAEVERFKFWHESKNLLTRTLYLWQSGKPAGLPADL